MNYQSEEGAFAETRRQQDPYVHEFLKKHKEHLVVEHEFQGCKVLSCPQCDDYIIVND